MAITSYGYDGSVTEARWAEIGYGMGYGAAPSVVVSGLDASVGAGTRVLALSAGTIVACNVEAISDAVVSLTAAANSSGATRRSYAIAKFDWSSNTTTIEIKGSGASLPALTRTPGVTWEDGLCTFDVANGASVVSNIKICKPTPRFTNTVPRSPGAVAQIFAANSGYTLDTVDLLDPGWNYRVKVSARIRVRTKSGTPGGVVLLAAKCDGVQMGPDAVSGPLLSGLTETSGVPVDLTDVSVVKSGPSSVVLVTTPGGSFPSPGSYEVLAGFGRFIVEQIPV